MTSHANHGPGATNISASVAIMIAVSAAIADAMSRTGHVQP
jgi:hypothetical protein